MRCVFLPDVINVDNSLSCLAATPTDEIKRVDPPNTFQE